jgi:gamma-glutamyltranspeptidase/glutathione hydrolase
LDSSPNYAELLKKDLKGNFHGPKPGEIFRNPNLAKTFSILAKEGKEGFYTGPIAEAIIKVTKSRNSFLELEDLQEHLELGTEPVEPISYVWKGQGYGKTQGKFVDGASGQGVNEDKHGVEIWEHPPNGQGIVALMALGILEALEESGKIPKFTPKQHNSAEYLHALIESLRIAFADASWYVADPAKSKVPSKDLISKPYLAERAKLFDPSKASSKIFDHGSPAHNHSDTVYFAVADKHGNGISFINSNFHGFGSGIIPAGTGFVLQNRGAGFRLEEGHLNAIAPSKRPYHTIIPAMVTNVHDGSLHSVYGVMGGFMQPQGHVQVLLNQLAFHYNPQTALDAPRFCIGAEFMPGDGNARNVYLEDGISEEVCEQLKKMGHHAQIVKGFGRGVFGRGQVIRSHVQDGQIVYSAGSDPRGDGAAFPV